MGMNDGDFTCADQGPTLHVFKSDTWIGRYSVR